MNPRSLLEQFQQKEDEYLWIQEILTGQELIIDSTQQTIYRPYADNKQKKYYPVKKEKPYIEKPNNNDRKRHRNSRCDCRKKRSRKRCKFTHKTTKKL